MPDPVDQASIDSFEQLGSVTLARARTICTADGVTFVLRDGENCFYVAEDACAPLWAGQRFPLEQCISGWAMLRDEVAHVPHPFSDDRIPHAAYRPTFVQSLVAVPIGRPAVGVIGVYWSQPGRTITPEELLAVSELCADTAVGIERLGLARAPWSPNFALPGATRPTALPVG